MSEEYTPRSNASSEFRAYVASHATTLASIATVIAVLVTLVVYIASKPSEAQVKEWIRIHESKNAHHGVQAKILASAPTRIDYALLRQRVGVLERTTTEWRRDMKNNLIEIKKAITDLSNRLPRPPQGYQQGRQRRR